MQPPRMTTRRIMIVVAIAAMLLGVGVELRRRTERLNRLSLNHSSEASRLEDQLVGSRISASQAKVLLDRTHWHDALAWKYKKAASRPWLTVAPDPPSP